MKKFLVILGSIFLVLIVLAAVGIGVAAIKGTALDKESKAYVDSVVPVVISGWNPQEILNRASPEFTQAVKNDDLNKLYVMFRRLGKFQTYEGSQGQSNMSVTNEGKRITAAYTAKATFETGPAVITISLIKHDDQWQILGFHIDSKAFLER